MQKINVARVLVLIFCLVVTGGLVYLRPEGKAQTREVALEQVLAQIKNWRKVAVSPLSPMIVEELKLDDYIFQTYARGPEKIDLYVGYYYSAAKIGAAHDPLVCFPGQGWQIKDNQKGRLQFTVINDYRIDYSVLLAEKSEDQELVVYWFQVGDQMAAGTFEQKLLMLKNKFLNRSVNNAFVRISTSLKGSTPQEGQERIFRFIRDFYPLFQFHVAKG